MNQRSHPTRRQIVALSRRALVLVFLLLMGLLCGMAIRYGIVPHLPTRLTRLLTGPKAEQQDDQSGSTENREVAFWKSSMIPNFVSPKPGVDPMNMDLVPVYMDELSDEKLITLSPAVAHNMGLRTAPVEVGTAGRVLRTIGEVDYAEPLLGDVTLKVGGWVQELFVDYVGQRVKKGQPLFTVYSPELFSTIEEYLLSVKTPESPATPPQWQLQTSRVFPADEKLRYWDVPESEIARFRQAGHPVKTVKFESPFDGWVIEKHAFRGMYMKPGARFYRIADLSKMWVYVTIFEYQLPDVHVGQTARLTLPFRPGKQFEGKVIYIYPYVDPKTRQIRVRLEFPNPDLQLNPGMYADVELQAPVAGTHILVPQDAVMYVGKRKKAGGQLRRVGYAYVKIGAGRFEPREVELGEEMERGLLQIRSGLKPGEEVVVSGQFQLDSERRVKEANLAMLMQSREESK